MTPPETIPHEQSTADAKYYGAFRRGLLPWLLASSLWAAQPYLQQNFLILTQQLRWYPVQADSIGIPILGAFMMAIIGAPFWLVFCYRSFKRLPRHRSCFAPAPTAWRQHPVRSLVLGCFILLTLWSLSTNVRLYTELVHSSYSTYAYFAICNGAASVGWALLWWILLNCRRSEEPPITGWSEAIDHDILTRTNASSPPLD
jgi:hypothetical protein